MATLKQIMHDHGYTRCPVCERVIRRGLLRLINHRGDDCTGFPAHVIKKNEEEKYKPKPMIWLMGATTKRMLDEACEGFLRQQERQGRYKSL